MNRLETFARKHPALFSLLVVIGFLALLIGPDFLLHSKSDYVIEAFGAAQRVVIALLAVALLRALGWVGDAGVRNGGSASSWIMIAVPLVYLGTVFPYLFTRSWAPNMHAPALTALVAVDAFAEGALEEFLFRGLIFLAFLKSWGRSRNAVVKAAVTSSVFFSLPHLTNMLYGQQRLRVIAQVGWAFVLGIAVAWMYYAAGSIWPVVVLHGGLDAIVAANRMGMHIQITPLKGLVMVAFSLPVLIYAWFVLRRRNVSRYE